MQRRTVAIYLVFFLVTGAGAYSVIAVAEQPHVDVEGTTLSANESATFGGQEYTLTEISASSGGGGGGHGGGGGGGTTYSGSLQWTNESARFTAELANDSYVDYDGGNYSVRIRNVSDPSEVTLHEQHNVTAMLRNDSAVYNRTTAIEGREYVTYRANNTNVLLDEYLPEPRTATFAEGDSLTYGGNQTTVVNVTAGRTLVEWTAVKNNTISLSEGSNVTLGGQQHVVHFRNQNAVVLSQDVAGYQQDLDRQAHYQERMNGLWGVSILSFMASVVMVGVAYLPVRG